MVYGSINPLFNDLKGVFNKDLVFSSWKNIPTARKTYTDTVKCVDMLIIQENFNKADDFFLTLTNEQKALWRHEATKKKKYTNYSYFMSINLKRLWIGLNILPVPP